MTLTDEQREVVERVRANMERSRHNGHVAASGMPRRKRTPDERRGACFDAARVAKATGETFHEVAERFGITAAGVYAGWRLLYGNETTKGRWKR